MGTGRYAVVSKEIRPEISSDSPPKLPSGDVQIGQWRIPSVVALAVVAAVGGYFTAQAQKPPKGDPSQLIAESTAAQAQQRQEIKNSLSVIESRVTSIETKIDTTRVAVDALRDRVNDRLSVPMPRDPQRDRINDALQK